MRIRSLWKLRELRLSPPYLPRPCRRTTFNQARQAAFGDFTSLKMSNLCTADDNFLSVAYNMSAAMRPMDIELAELPRKWEWT